MFVYSLTRVNSHNNWFPEVRTGGFPPAGFAVLPHRNIHRFRKWAERIGINTHTVVNAILTSKRVEQQTYRSCMGLLKLTDKYSEALLEAACEKALFYTSSPSYKSIKNILVTGSVKTEPESSGSKTTHKAHSITRGADYYRR